MPDLSQGEIDFAQQLDNEYLDAASLRKTHSERMQTAQDRVARIVTKLNTFNRANPQQPLMLNGQLMEIAAGLDAVVAALIDAGLVTVDDYAARRAERIADMFEQAWAESAPARRQANGLVIPGR